MIIQFTAVVLAAIFLTPRTWSGATSSIHIHVYAAIGIGSVLSAFPIFFILRNPGDKFNQYVISVSQLMYSGLLIHLTGGRIETHFHVFGSMAFLAFYRDWKVLIPATLITATDHLARAVFWPESIFGVITSAPWRAVEHAGWVIFENIFLTYSCVMGMKEVWMIADRQAELEMVNGRIEQAVHERTRERGLAFEALEQEIQDRTRLESELVEAQRLETIGQLAAGIAHEINTPAQYVADNTRFLQSEFSSILKIIDQYASQLDSNSPSKSWAERSQEIADSLQTIDYEFIRDEIPLAINQSLEGIERISGIIKAMKDFSHPGSDERVFADLNTAIKSTAMVCSNKWKFFADLELELDEALTPIPCYTSQLNQVFLNLIVNAVDAIESRFSDSGERGIIKIRTKNEIGAVVISVEDNGIGMSQEVSEKMFNPFYTTKEVGKGTGQGLSISRDIIVNKHQGVIRCTSEVGVGTTFTIVLPNYIEEQVEAKVA